MKRRSLRATLPLMASALVVAAGIAAYVNHARREALAERAPLVPLQPFDLETFKKTFNAGAGEVRVLAMLSPT